MAISLFEIIYLIKTLMLNRPNFIPADVAVPELNYKWNNSIAVSLGEFTDVPERLCKAIYPINYKGAMGLKRLRRFSPMATMWHRMAAL